MPGFSDLSKYKGQGAGELIQALMAMRPQQAQSMTPGQMAQMKANMMKAAEMAKANTPGASPWQGQAGFTDPAGYGVGGTLGTGAGVQLPKKWGY